MARRKITPETSEKSAVKDWLSLNGWFNVPFMAGLGAYPGLPDRMAIKNGRVVLLEVKAPGGRQSERQIEFEADWNASGGEYVCGTLDDIIAKLKPHV